MSDEVQRALGRIEGQLEASTQILKSIKDDFRAHAEEDNHRFGEVNKQLSSLSKRVYLTSGTLGILTAFLTSFFKSS